MSLGGENYSYPDNERRGVSSNMLTMHQFRQMFPTLEEVAYLDTAQRGLTPQALTDAGCRVLQDWQALKSNRELGAQAKAKIAKLLRVEQEEIALVSSTAQGINRVASAIAWQPGDNVVLTDSEHASNFFPWSHLRERGVELRLVPCPSGILQPEDYRTYVDSRTRAVSASLVTFYPGAWLDARKLATIAHAAGALFVVDAVQAVGILPVYPHELGADILVAAAYKGFMSAHGAGFIYVRKEVLPDLVPAHLYIFNVDGELGMIGDAYTSPEYSLRPTGARFEGGHHAVGVAQMNVALDYILDLGVEQIAEHVSALALELGNGLVSLGYKLDTPLTPEYLRSIVCVRMAAGKELSEYLAENGVIASARRHGLRLALHAYNNMDDVRRALDAFASFPKRS